MWGQVQGEGQCLGKSWGGPDLAQQLKKNRREPMQGAHENSVGHLARAGGTRGGYRVGAHG